jgi:hypothetical protein
MNKQKIILKWLNKGFGNLNIVVKGNITYYVDKDKLPLFFYNQASGTGIINISDDRIWLLLETIFVMNNPDVRELLNIWLSRTYNLRGRIPLRYGMVGEDFWTTPII